MSTDVLGRTLLQLARAAIAARLHADDQAAKLAASREREGSEEFQEDEKGRESEKGEESKETGRALADEFVAARLQAPGACFVTLTEHGHLRGCIGSLQAWRPLLDDVRANAVAAALRDSRFAPLCAAELPAVRIEVSLLGPSTPLRFRNETDALAQLRPGEDGVILDCDGRCATFLPQVWDELPFPAEFLAQLKRKAGLPAAYWSEHMRLSRYAVQQWKEP